jgi:hypothetical protein
MRPVRLLSKRAYQIGGVNGTIFQVSPALAHFCASLLRSTGGTPISPKRNIQDPACYLLWLSDQSLSGTL